MASALALYHRALGAFGRIGDRAEEARILAEIAAVLLESGDLDAARERFCDSIRAYSDVGSIRASACRYSAWPRSPPCRGATRHKGTNQVEAYYSQLKRCLDGTHHHVSREHLQRYLGEFDFRFSTCKMSDAEHIAFLIQQCDGRLSYQALTGA